MNDIKAMILVAFVFDAIMFAVLIAIAMKVYG